MMRRTQVRKPHNPDAASDLRMPSGQPLPY
ncbi:hypothetical protein FHR33_008352 [Nonomuraea dietziae]|uniref:Uncharacterized protein n=1 Tax=Nonomuraea dietziae TaxID=65515 RepID=A0A7W5V8C6_9ACTN|nr:hypothetical protein [Nonomuraea dietziae]